MQLSQANQGREKKIRPVPELITERQERLLGHLLRGDGRSLTMRVRIEEGFLKHVPMKRRVGGPRQHWVDKTMERAYEKVRYQTSDEGDWQNSEEQRMVILAAALEKLI